MLNLLSPVMLLNRFAPTRHLKIELGVVYAAGSRHQLDIYSPKQAGSAPVVVFFYGGGWEEGDRDYYRFAAAALANMGVVVVVPDYRVYPQTVFPGFVEDGALAVRWTFDRIAEHGGNPRRIFLMGHSAGAHIAAMLAFDRRYLAAHGLEPGRDLAGIIGLSGPYDFLPLHSEVLKTIFGPPETLARSQPIEFVDGSGPPALLITGGGDRTVDPGNTTRLAARIRSKGGVVRDITVPHIGHAPVLGAIAAPLRFLAPTFRAVRDFIRAETAT